MTSGPIFRLAVGWVGISAMLVVIADLVIGVLPDMAEQSTAHHREVARMITNQVADKVTRSDYTSIGPSLDLARRQFPAMHKVEVRNVGGAVIADSGALAPAEAGQYDRAVVAILSPEGRWGEVEFQFAPYYPSTWSAWLARREFWLAIGLPLCLLAVAYLYLRRTLLYLDPMSVVPDRIRAGFDGLTEGVALLDLKHRVVLANRALRELVGHTHGTMVGKPLSATAKLALPDGTDVLPWIVAATSGQAVLGMRVTVEGGPEAKAGRMNCSPVTDGSGRVRGTLVTIADLSAIEKANDDLRRALGELERSREQIESQNRELMHLAMNDGLTGLMNRRAYFDAATSIVSRNRQTGRPFAVLMLDVDHFKSFNDRYGHAMGDAVLKRVAECLRTAVRTGDWTGRYGGEEFSALLDGATTEEALATAERLRELLEQTAGRGIHDGQDLRVTASIGVATFPPLDEDFESLVNLADAALYAAKHGGRNRVELAKKVAGEATTA